MKKITQEELKKLHIARKEKENKDWKINKVIDIEQPALESVEKSRALSTNPFNFQY